MQRKSRAGPSGDNWHNRADISNTGRRRAAPGTSSKAETVGVCSASKSLSERTARFPIEPGDGADARKADFVITTPASLHSSQQRAWRPLAAAPDEHQVSSGPDLHYRLRSRPVGSFGRSPLGRIAESVTLSWFRFEVFLLWMIVVCAATSAQNMSSALLILIASPATALTLWVLIKLLGWIFYFIPAVGRFWGWGRLLFLTLFSRLIVQEPPGIDLPLWNSAR